MDKMSDAQIEAALKTSADWSEIGGGIQRTFQFKDFVGAMAFVNKVATAAEAAQHHPDILVRWNKVTLSLSTHDAGGITEKDFNLAKQVDGIFGPTAPAATPGPVAGAVGPVKVKTGGKGAKK